MKKLSDKQKAYWKGEITKTNKKILEAHARLNKLCFAARIAGFKISNKDIVYLFTGPYNKSTTKETI